MMIEVRNRADVLRFEGSKIAHVSAEMPSKDRWSEFSVYVTTSGEFVLQGVGRSRVPGEVDRPWAVISQDPLDILDAIVGKNASRLAKKLLAESLLSLVATREPGPQSASATASDLISRTIQG